MRAITAAIQEGRAELHLTVDELADRSGIPPEDIWRLLDEGWSAPAAGRRTLDGLAQGLHRPPEVLYRAALVDAGVTPPSGPVDAGWLAVVTRPTVARGD